MGLYDQAKMQDSPYLSQYVGSIVPELADYSKIVQTRYNDAASSDDQLTEALNNLQHLGLAGDTQYANELKQKYYQQLQDRSAQGDYENMGRRVHRDAMNFSAAYQPLIQRQNDLATIVKRVNGDNNIADPEKKAQILEYIQHMNQTPVDPNTGGFVRDQAGRVQLNAIQDWNYAKDVDVNKKLSDLLSKKEADINQTGYTSVGGYRVSTKTELRDPRVMARLADEIQQTDPEIKAMINRDVTLQNYKLDDSQIAGGIKEASITPYQRLKQKGFSDHDIAIQAKAAGMSLDDAKQSPVAQRIAHLLSSGRTSEAANRQVYDELTAQQMRDPSSQLMGDLFSVHKVTQDEHTDEWAIAQWKHQMDLADKFNGNFQLIPTSPVNTENLNPEDITDNYVKKQKALTGVQQSLQASVMVAAKKAGLLTGDTKKDLFTTQAITEDGTKLASLVDKLKSIDPILADRLQSAGNTYYQNRSELNSHKTNTEGIEEASGVDPKQLYQDYLKDLNSNKGISQKPLDYNAFLNGIRSKDDPNTSTLTRVVNALPGITNPYQDARNKYWDKVKGTTGSLGFWASVAGAGMTGDYEAIARKAGEAQGGFNKYKSAMRGYTTMNPVNDADYFGKMTGALEDQTKNNVLQVRDLSKTDDTPGTLASKIGIDPTTAAGREALKGTKVLFNNEPGPGGKVTASVFTPDGEHHVLALDNLDPTTQQDIYTRMYEAAGMTANSTYAKSRQQKVLSAAGQSTMNQISMIDLQNRQPSGQKYPINDKYAVRIITGGSEGKRYQLFRNNMNTNSDPEPMTYKGKPIILNSPDDVAITLGSELLNNTMSAKVKARINSQ